MRAAIFERQGLENLNVKDTIQQPTITDHDVLIKVKSAGVNPIDYLTVSNMPGIKPIPHIPGAESAGIIEKVGGHLATLKEGDKVVVYNSIFDGTCDMCLSGGEMLCRKAGIFGVITNGGFADYISAAEKNVFKIPDNVQWNIAANLATTTKTPYHALREASLTLNEFLVIFGASGNTGMAVQFGKNGGKGYRSF
jgi:D-arabinose 1-dehydrogenase-like Zn-dependent alcohol dehydrogenase